MTNSPTIAIVGGGPVGLYLANILIQKNHKVILFEKRSWPVDKVCGQGLMPSGFERLGKLGLKFTQKNSYALRGIHYIDSNDSLKGQLKNKALGVERSVLSVKLLEKLKLSRNITLLDNTTVDNISENSDKTVHIQTTAENYDFDYVFCCDGMHSKSRERLGLTQKRKSDLRMGARVHYNISPWDDMVQVYWNEGIEAYVTPVSESKIEVAYLWYESKMDKGGKLEERLLAKFPKLASQLNVDKKLSDFKAYGPFVEYSSKINQNNIFFLGDAYHFKDGITGEGVSLGLKTADIIVQGFERFSRVHAFHIYLLYLNYRLWIGLSLLLSRSPRLRKIVMKASNLWPPFFNTCLDLNDYSFKFMRKLY